MSSCCCRLHAKKRDAACLSFFGININFYKTVGANLLILFSTRYSFTV
jgi:hypothetical protein